jgi:hypothetical protein
MHRELDTKGIMRLSGFSPGRSWQNPGLTLGAHELQTSFRITGETRSGVPGVCVWLQALDVDFRYTDIDVYVSSDYADGSCEAKEILDHEMDHVEVHRRLYGKYRAELEIRLKAVGFPTESNPKRYPTMKAAKDDVGRLLRSMTDSLYARFKRELKAENAKLDTPANYKAIQSRCMGWR